MKSYHWNVVSGVIFLLVAIYVMIGLGASVSGDSGVAPYIIATSALTLLASIANFVRAWVDRRRSRAEGEPTEEPRPLAEPEA